MLAQIFPFPFNQIAWMELMFLPVTDFLKGSLACKAQTKTKTKKKTQKTSESTTDFFQVQDTLRSLCVFNFHSPPAFGDMFPHKHTAGRKFPVPVPPIPGWAPDTNPWDDYLYPPLNPKPNKLMHHRGESLVFPLDSF